MNMPRYLFQLGREAALSTAELRAVFSPKEKNAFRLLAPGWLLMESADAIDPMELMARLGGTIKIAELSPTVSPGAARIAEYLLKTQSSGKIVFSLSGEEAKKLSLAVKLAVKESGRSVRYIEPKNTATILHNGLLESKSDLMILHGQVFVTVAIQPIEALSARDFGRPGRDSRSGLLPPKLAQIMINLAEVPTTATLLDPFCGSGTILMEAMLMGYTNLIGSDVSEKAIEDTKKNMEWLKEKMPNAKIKMPNSFVYDATQISQKIPASSVDAIVTEPNLGKPLRGNENESFLKKQAEELKNLYIKAFGSFAKMLKPGGVVIFIMPSFRSGNTWITTHCPSEIEALGFRAIPLSEDQPYLRYRRPDQHVARDIWKFVLVDSTNGLPPRE